MSEAADSRKDKKHEDRVGKCKAHGNRKRSFEIITEETGRYSSDAGNGGHCQTVSIPAQILTYARNLYFSEKAVDKALAALKKGACIVTDTQMAKAGINKRALARFGGEVYCFMADEDVADLAKKNGTTRATASMDKAAGLDRPLIFAVGNAPTALVRLLS